MFNVNESLLRFWEKEFPHITPNKSRGGVRQYTKENIEDIRLVYYLVKEIGMTLPGARQQLSDRQRRTTERNFEIISRLKALRDELTTIKKELDRYPNSQHQPPDTEAES